MLHCCRKHRWVKCKIYIRNTFSNLKKQTFLFNVPPSFSANFQNKRTICSFLEDWSKIRRIHSKLKTQTFLLNPKSEWGWVDCDYTFCRQLFLKEKGLWWFNNFLTFPASWYVQSETRTTIVVSNGRYTFYQTQFIKYHLSNTIYPIPFIKYHLSNTIY